VLAPGSAGNVLQLFEDLPLNYDAWDIDRYFEDKAWQIDSVESVRVTETGPVRGTVEIRRSFSRSTIVQRLHVYDAIPRIDFHTEVDWHETHTLLKAAFPVSVNASRATYEIQFGVIDRPTHRNTSWDQAQFEVCAQKWADLSEGDYGVSLLNDCKYGYDVEGNVMRISLLRSPTKPDPLTDQGSHEFTYSLMPHPGDWRNGSTRAGYELNYPMTAVRVTGEGASDGRLPKEMSLVAPDRDGLFVDTVKLAEDDDRLVVRCYEGHNTRGPANLQFGVPAATAREIDLLERDEGPASLSDGTLTFDVAPYEVRTFVLET
jgi:alpha-mannosidase